MQVVRLISHNAIDGCFDGSVDASFDASVDGMFDASVEALVVWFDKKTHAIHAATEARYLFVVEHQRISSVMVMGLWH